MVLSFIIRGTGKGRRAGWSISWWGCASGDGKILRCAQDDSCPFLEQVRRVGQGWKDPSPSASLRAAAHALRMTEWGRVQIDAYFGLYEGGEL
jgi:hypothetical protein